MQYPNHFENDTRVTYYGSVSDFDFYMNTDNEIIIQFGEQEHEYMCMPLEYARQVKATHYQAAVAIWDLNQAMLEVA